MKIDKQKTSALGAFLVIITLCICWHLYDNNSLKLNYESQLSESRQRIAVLRADMLAKDALLQKQSDDLDKIKIILDELGASKSPATTTPAARSTPLIMEKHTASAVEQLYNPERSKTDKQSNMDEIKKRYEDMFVLHMFLKKCGKIKPADYGIITHALTQEIVLAGAAAHLQIDIMSAAEGSYKEIYSQSQCGGQGMDALYAQYTDYLNVLSANFPQ